MEAWDGNESEMLFIRWRCPACAFAVCTYHTAGFEDHRSPSLRLSKPLNRDTAIHYG
jgi:hypothetical protein